VGGSGKTVLPATSVFQPSGRSGKTVLPATFSFSAIWAAVSQELFFFGLKTGFPQNSYDLELSSP